MTVEFFVTALLVVSALTGLVTESVKKLLDEYKVKYFANTLAGICALVVSIIVGVGYIIYTSTTITPTVIVMLVALVLLSWLCAMLGYDKVIQTIMQFSKKQG